MPTPSQKAPSGTAWVLRNQARRYRLIVRTDGNRVRLYPAGVIGWFSSLARPSPSVLASNGIAISMDGKGAWRDNVFVERLWRSVKYEEVYLRAYESVSEARATRSAATCSFIMAGVRTRSFDGTTPDQAYLTPLPLRLAA